MTSEDGHVELPTWPAFSRGHILCPLLAQAGLMLALPVLAAAYAGAWRRSSCFRHLMEDHLGTRGKPLARHPALTVWVEFLQLVISGSAVWTFIARTYTQYIPVGGWLAYHVAANVYFAAYYFVQLARGGFDWKDAWRLGPLIDVLTVAPVFYEASHPAEQRTWLSFLFLRAYRVGTAYQRLEGLAPRLRSESWEFNRHVFSFLLQMLALIVTMGGTVYALEVLGEVPGWEDRTMDVTFGAISFPTVMYWMVTTLSTVGYGDFAPTTIPSRWAVVAFIIVGCTFFADRCMQLAQLRSLLNNGRGCYYKLSEQDVHVVVTVSSSRSFQLLGEFLQEVLAQNSAADPPDVVVLSEAPYDSDAVQSVRSELPYGVRDKVIFLVGSALSPADLQRSCLAECVMAFVFPDLQAADAREEDGHNILRVVHMRGQCPDLRIRLLLLEPESKLDAVRLGIRPQTCLSAMEVKSALLAQSTRVFGFIALMGGLLTSPSTLQIGEAEERCAASRRSRWMLEYLAGLRYCVSAFVARGDMVDMSFTDACLSLYDKSDGAVLLFAAQEHDHIMLNYTGIIHPEQVLFALATSDAAVQKYTDHAETGFKGWRQTFLERRSRIMMPRTASDIPCGMTDEAWALRLHQLLQDELHYDLVGAPPSEPPPPDAADVDDGVSTSASSVTAVAVSSEATGGGEQSVVASKRELTMVILIGDSGADWIELACFLRSLRQPFLPQQQAISVLSSTRPPQAILDRFQPQLVSFFQGPISRARTLVDAGLLQATAVTIVRGTGAGGSGSGIDTDTKAALADHRIVQVAGLVENILSGSSRLRLTLCDLGSTQSLRLVDDVCKQVHDSLQKGFRFFGRPSQGFLFDEPLMFKDPSLTKAFFADEERRNPIARCCESIAQRVRRSFSQERTTWQDARAFDPHQLFLAPGFATGTAFTPHFFGRIMGYIFHCPVVFELLEAFCLPEAQGQMSFIWQVRCPPEWVSRLFGDIVVAWAGGCQAELGGGGPALVLGLYRMNPSRCPKRQGPFGIGGTDSASAATTSVAKDDSDDFCSEASLTSQGEENFKERFKWGGVQGYAATLPPRDARLQANDRLTVLASAAFGKAMASRGLLCGTDGEASAAAAPPTSVADGVGGSGGGGSSGEESPEPSKPAGDGGVFAPKMRSVSFAEDYTISDSSPQLPAAPMASAS